MVFVMVMLFFEGLLLISRFSREISISTVDQLLIHVLQSLCLQSAMCEQGSYVLSFYLKQTQCRDTVLYTSSSELFSRLPPLSAEKITASIYRKLVLFSLTREAPLSAILKSLVFCRQQAQYSNQMFDEVIVFMIFICVCRWLLFWKVASQLTGPNLKILRYDLSVIGIPIHNILTIIKLLSNISTGLV